LLNKIMRKANAFWLCVKSRFSRAVIFPYATLLATFTATRGVPPVLPTIMAAIAGTFIALSIYISNDVMDLETDRANIVTRPVVQEEVSKKDALIFSLILTITGTVMGLSINLTTFLLCAAGAMLGFMYSFSPIYLKRRFILKQLAVASGGLISSLTGGAAVGMISSSVLFSGFIFFTYAMAVVPIVDLGDMIGDKKEGRKTLPIVWGPEYTIRLAIAIVFAIIISGMVGYFQLGFNLALPILVGVTCLSFIYVLYPLFNRWQDYVYCRKLVNKITLIHFLLQLSIVIGSIRFQK